MKECYKCKHREQVTKRTYACLRSGHPKSLGNGTRGFEIVYREDVDERENEKGCGQGGRYFEPAQELPKLSTEQKIARMKTLGEKTLGELTETELEEYKSLTFGVIADIERNCAEEG